MKNIKQTDPAESSKFLAYYKAVLNGVGTCNDQPNFEKELKKSEQHLLVEDLKLLVNWALDNFASIFKDLKETIKSLFSYLFPAANPVSA